jgi:DNA topoisomerase-1
LEINNQEEAENIAEQLRAAAYLVAKVSEKRTSRQPAPPFITSTLQQEAWRKLHFTAQRTMAVAQQLYEGLPIGEEGVVGLITYMRTDSTRVADSAIQETRGYIEKKYGVDFLPARPRGFTKKVKGAQEAHEAIRPTRVEHEPRLIQSYLTADQSKLYELIWKRMVASQMAAASFDNTAVDIEAEEPQEKKTYLLRATASVPHFLGFRILYSEGKDEVVGEEENESPLPQLTKSEELQLRDISPQQHFTQPLPRYNEATLVKALEERGIGRPSTYAPIISIIRRRGYVQRKDGRFYPLELGLAVSDLLVEHFPNIVDIEFTAQMEERLDEVARGKQGWVAVVQDFYTPLEQTLQKAHAQITRVKIPDQSTDEVCPQCGKPMVVRMGRYGRFLACSGFPQCKFTKPITVKKRRKNESPGYPRPKS